MLKFYECHEDDEAQYLVTEYVKGCDLLGKLKKRDDSMSESKLRLIMTQIVNGLKALHKQGIMHRDIKLENILVSKCTSGRRTYKICDFGVSMMVEGPDSFEELCIGTMRYMAPEMLENKSYNQKIDIWSLGVVFFTLTTGSMPFVGEDSHQVQE